MKKEQILQIINYREFKKRIIYCKMIEYFVKLLGTVIISNGWVITELLLQEVHFTTFFTQRLQLMNLERQLMFFMI